MMLRWLNLITLNEISHFTFVIYELKIQIYVFFITRYIKLSKDSLRTHGSHATVPHGLSQLFL